MTKPAIARVALDHLHAGTFDYLVAPGVHARPGQLVSVPFGRRQCIGIVCDVGEDSALPLERLKPLTTLCEAWPPLRPEWLALVGFAAGYYQRGIGEVALPAVPAGLRDPKRWARQQRSQRRYVATAAGRAALPGALPARASAQRRLAEALLAAPLAADALSSLHPRAAALLDDWQAAGWVGMVTEAASSDAVDQRLVANLVSEPVAEPVADAVTSASVARALASEAPAASIDRLPTLTDEQRAAVDAIAGASGFDAFLLHGITGSGKTEVYLRAVAHCLAQDADAQALLLVPEINLTPQFMGRLRARFAALGEHGVVALHSGLSEGERAANWLAAHQGRARIVIGTRLAALASFRKLSLLIVDEEHEAAYKQQEGLRYSARDLCVWRAKHLGVPVVLGSATPSLESWCHAEQGRYRRLVLSRRPAADTAALPTVRTVDLDAHKRQGRLSGDGLSSTLLDAMRERLARGEQSLLFLNRRGYAPVLSCDACGWVSECTHCSAYLVLHRGDGMLRCHHCSWQEAIPHACPSCGNIDLRPLGRGTQRIEAALAEVMPDARVLRIDADSTRRRGSAEALFADVHAGRVDVLIGTNMVAKGHDFQRVTLVGVLNADSALFSHDFRASERLFGQLMQVAGRAGRADLPGEVLIQTRYPHHPLYAALARHDYAGYARMLTNERRDAHLPPFIHQALLKAEARTLEGALAFLEDAAARFDTLDVAADGRVVRYAPVPLAMVKINDTYRAQLLLESASRQALHLALSAWRDTLGGHGVLRWAIEVDPLEI
ncbi:primosomal protein N' [Chitinasiproducens palmae]|uniref:Replication restart protein PriA n=1 Tax=Chitinasiproducens palmae TaxID=1770053 RepID=A0A1H2PQ92_9BURK|nr:replication restart DNA helicase PriA [Chitinasiproducens palmae]